DDASKCEISFYADELGEVTLVCERSFTPVRWSLRRRASGRVVRLHDDSGGASARVGRHTIDRPLEEEQLLAPTEYPVDPTGGLYVARVGDFRSLIIVPPFGSDFATLRRDPRIAELNRSADSVVKLLTCLDLWSCAYITGDLFSGFYQRKVTEAIES